MEQVLRVAHPLAMGPRPGRQVGVRLARQAIDQRLLARELPSCHVRILSSN
jgi:hypothetical protein